MRGDQVGRGLEATKTLWRDLVFRSIVFAALLNFGLVIAIYAPNPKANHPANQQSEGDRVGPPVVAEKTPEERTADYTYWLTAETFILAVSTVGLWIVTWRSAANQTRDMERSHTLSRETAERQLRAYLVVEPAVLIDQESAPGAYFEAQPVLINSGQTPAYDVVANSRLCVLPFPIPPEFDFPLAHLTYPSIRVLGPSQRTSLICGLDHIASPAQLAMLKSYSPVRLVAYGTILYRDIFGRTQETRYSFFFQWGSKGIPIWFCTNRHNEAT